MVDWYLVSGWVNTLFISISVYGIALQLLTVWRRKAAANHATAILSLNQFMVSFLAYLAFFVYGYSVEPFNHFIVWPRLAASVIVGLILFEIWVDRRTSSALVSVLFGLLLLFAALAGLAFGAKISDQGKMLSTVLIIVVSLLIAQGYYRQIRLILRAGQTGAVDIRMSQFILLMDASTIAFACAMGFEQGWPLMVLAVTSGATKIIILYLFRWVRVSPQARARRAAACSYE